jgi:hypothetical protein
MTVTRAQVLAFVKNFVDSTGVDVELSCRFEKNGKFYFTRWTKFSEWDSKYKNLTPNYRSILPCELVLETDLPTKEQNFEISKKIMLELKKRNYPFWCKFTGSKSYHSHLLIPDLLLFNLDEKKDICRFLVNSWFSPEIAKLIDGANFKPRTLIQLEVSTNPKTGIDAVLVEEKLDGVPPKQLLGDASEACFAKPMGRHAMNDLKSWKRELIPRNCDALNYLIENKVPSGNFTRYEYISPSLSAYIRHKSNRNEIAAKYYGVQGKLGDLEAWDKKPSNFSCRQIRIFMKYHKLYSICEKCLVKGGF